MAHFGTQTAGQIGLSPKNEKYRPQRPTHINFREPVKVRNIVASVNLSAVVTFTRVNWLLSYNLFTLPRRALVCFDTV